MIPESERSPGEGNGYLLQYSCLENFEDRGTWQATVHGVAKSQTLLWGQCTHTYTHTHVKLVMVKYSQWAITNILEIIKNLENEN